jgi:hypothetical protein
MFFNAILCNAITYLVYPNLIDPVPLQYLPYSAPALILTFNRPISRQQITYTPLQQSYSPH